MKNAEALTRAVVAIEKGPGHDGPHIHPDGGAGIAGEMAAAVAAREVLCRIQRALSPTWIKENMPIPITGGRCERLHQSLR